MKKFNAILGVIINALRSFPFIILMILLFPLSRFVVENFMVNKSLQPLAMVDVELIKNASCNTTAQVRIKVKEGTPPYRYTITTSNTDPRTRAFLMFLAILLVLLFGPPLSGGFIYEQF